MARRKRRRKTSRKKTSQNKKSPVANLLGLALLLLMLVGLFQLGMLGTLINHCFQILVGSTYPVVEVVLGLCAICITIYGQWPHFRWTWIVGFIVFYLGLLTYVHYQMFNTLGRHTDFINITWNNITKTLFDGDTTFPLGGGMIGAYLFDWAFSLVDNVGALVGSWLVMIAGAVIFFQIPLTKVFGHLAAGVTATGNGLAKAHQKGAELHQRHLDKRQAKEAERAAQGPSKVANRTSLADRAKNFTGSFLPSTKSTASVSQPSASTSHQQSTSIARPTSEPTITVASSQHSASQESSQASQPVSSRSESESESAEPTSEGNLATMVNADDDKDYQLPPLSLLTPSKHTDQSKDLKSIKTNTKKLQQTLASFGVDVTVENVSLGPTVTKYELRPAVGVKVSKITNLADDLALALAAKDIRIEAPIPGKSLIGIEVPNQQVATVGFRDMIEAAPHDDKPLDVPLGRTVTGEVMTADLTKMPHLLIAGATGSGKSVAINVIITSILLKDKPSQVKMLMIDPKKVELSVYNGIPHLLSPVVSEPKKAARALGKVVSEMERRYELFAKLGVRNIKGYNKLATEHSDDKDAQPPMPLILVIVDELSDLMMTVSHDVEDAIVRIAQMGRAAGIHMILATQRPSVDVITGLIKANVPSRIAFAVSSGIDSRTIIDTNGAEKLLGRGDMLFQPVDKNKPIRIQGAFISDHDVEAVVDFIKKERPAEYDEKMVVTDAEMKNEEQAEEEDELYPDAVDFVTREQKASTSLIQRRFRIGYNRAARIIDSMEAHGVIGPANGSKPREVLKAAPKQ